MFKPGVLVVKISNIEYYEISDMVESFVSAMNAEMYEVRVEVYKAEIADIDEYELVRWIE